jgi:hypothetical protein
MIKSTPAKLAYQKAYNAQPKQTAKRVVNNAARRSAIRDGKVKVGDGLDIAHKRSLENGGGNKPGNLIVQAASSNRGWRKGSASYNPDKSRAS